MKKILKISILKFQYKKLNLCIINNHLILKILYIFSDFLTVEDLKILYLTKTILKLQPFLK